MEERPLQAGSVVDRWTVEGPLGEGGMARVWRVRHNVLGTHHALKVLSLASSEVRRRMLQEGKLQSSLQHPNVVAVTDVVSIGESPGLVMELVDGPPLDRLLRQRRLTLPQVDELARGILAGVAAAHARGLVHRDLKPANILLRVTEQGFVPKVADFGLAKVTSASEEGYGRTRTGSTMGTPHYMSPEQIRDAKNVGPATDVFALGAILYEMVTGHRAFDGADLLEIFNAVASGRFDPPGQHAPDLPDRMERAILAALATDPQQRPASVDALAALWTGETVAVSGSVFDPDTIAIARSLSDGPPPAEDRRTWAASEAVSEPPVTGSIERSSGSSASLARGAVLFGLGGTAILAFALLALVAIGLGTAGLVAARRAGRAPTPVQYPLESAPAEAASAPAEAASAPLHEGTAEVPPAPPAPPPPTPAEPPRAAEPPPAGAPPAEPPPAEPPPAEPPPAEPVPAAQEGVAEVEPAPAPARGPELGPLLSDPDPIERKKGIANLARRIDDEADVVLEWVVQSERDAGVRRAAWEAVVDRWEDHRGDWYRIERVVAWLAAHGTEREALAALAQFARHGEQPELLRGALAHRAGAVRAAAVDAVVAVAPRATEGTDVRPLLAPLASDPDPIVAARATEALSRLP